MGLLIREAKEKDLEEILVIYNDAVINTTAVYQYHPHTLEMRREWFEKKVAEGYPVFVAEDNFKVIGFSTYGPFRAWPGYKYTVESSVYVHPDHRGKRIGGLLMAPIVEFAGAKDLHAIVAGIDATNEQSIRLHKQLGFVQVALFKEVGFKFDKWLDLVFMELVLTTPAHPIDG